MTLWLISLHIIAVVCWFAGLFYLPRLFVYHSQALKEQDQTGCNRFKIMEKKLFQYIMTPSGIATTLLGFAIIQSNPNYYWHQGWLHAKLGLVVLLWFFHAHCGIIINSLKLDHNPFSEKFYRIYNELPSLVLVSCVILVIVKPF